MRKISFLFAIMFITGTSVKSQCYPDRHNTSWFNAWISCEASINPNPVRGESHWILYNLNHTYSLGSTHFWNINDPNNMDRGINEAIIDYSEDGSTWTELGTFVFDIGTGESNYEGMAGPDFNSAIARYVLITPLSNHGGTCFGFSEIKMDVNEVISTVQELTEKNICFNVSIYPNPHIESFKAIITSECNEELSYEIYDGLGRLIDEKEIGQVGESYEVNYSSSFLSPGIYQLVITQGNISSRFSIVKIRQF